MSEKKIIDGVLYGVSAVIFDRMGKVLMFYRQNDVYKSGWEFVKGGLHVGESHYMAAIREIKEEAGTIKVEFVAELPKTYMVDVGYRRKNYSWVKKKTLVFMYLSGTPQIDNHEHARYEWLTISNACDVCWVEHGEEILNESFVAFNQWLQEVR